MTKRNYKKDEKRAHYGMICAVARIPADLVNQLDWTQKDESMIFAEKLAQDYLRLKDSASLIIGTQIYDWTLVRTLKEYQKEFRNQDDLCDVLDHFIREIRKR